MERGRQPVTAVELVRIAQAMQVPIQYLLSELGAASPAEPFRVLLPLPQASAGLCLRLTFRADGLEIVQLSPEAEREIPCLWPAAT
jgi:hypothetical protein